MTKPAAPFRSIDIGDIRITYLPDGACYLEPEVFMVGSSPEDWAQHKDWLDEKGRIVTSIGGMLVQTGDRNILVDTGFGHRHEDIDPFGPHHGGDMLTHLRKAGVSPEEIDTVMFTHLHLDHVGWATVEVDGRHVPTFANAEYVIRSSEWNHWAGKDDWTGMRHEEMELPIQDRVKLYDSDATLARGVDVLATPGHTPGHNSIVVSSGNERAIILGDVIHCPIQLSEMDWSCAFDVDPVAARLSRERMMRELEDPSTVGASHHFAEFSFGRIMRGEAAPSWNFAV